MPSRVKWYSPYKNTKPISAIESLSFSLPQEVKMSDQVILRCVELSQGWVINSQICFHQIWCEIIKGYQGGHLFVNTDSFPQNWDSIVMVIPFNWRTNLILDAQQGPDLVDDWGIHKICRSGTMFPPQNGHRFNGELPRVYKRHKSVTHPKKMDMDGIGKGWSILVYLVYHFTLNQIYLELLFDFCWLVDITMVTIVLILTITIDIICQHRRCHPKQQHQQLHPLYVEFAGQEENTRTRK